MVRLTETGHTSGHPNHPNWPSLVLQLTALPTICPCQRQHQMNLLSTTRTMWLVWGMVWRWGPWFLWMGWWGWMAGWSVKNRMRCWTWPLRWAPSCSQPSPCHWASSWINTDHASSDCWAGNQRRDGNEPWYFSWKDLIFNLWTKSYPFDSSFNFNCYQRCLMWVSVLQHMFWIVLSTHCLWSLPTKW